MTPKNLAIMFAGALSILYGYMIIDAYTGSGEVEPLHFLGLALALGLLVIEVGSSKTE